MRWLVVGALFAALSAAPVSASLSRDAEVSSLRPTLRLLSSDPLAVRGENFKPGERVVVRLIERTERSLRVTASERGSFVADFDRIEIGRCETFWLSATGSRGSRAALKRIAPACLPDKALGPERGGFRG
jgi:hypothetical protein